MQFALLKDEGKSKVIESVSTNALHLSPYNPRRSRSEADVKKLAERIDRNGYEITRAVWAYKNEDGYGVFAGGTRLQAAQMAGVESIPVVIHEGFTPDEITRLADEDNENDEYHSPVSIVDVWQDYKRLSELPADEYGKWTQERIAKAKGVNRALVSARIQYASLPESVLTIFVKNDSLKEGHSAEITKLLHFNNFFPWLDREAAMLAVIDSVLKRTKTPTAAQFATEVDRVNALVSSVGEMLAAFPEEWRALFLGKLATAKVMIVSAAKSIHSEITSTILADARRKEAELDRQRSAAEQERRKVEEQYRRDSILKTQLEKVIRGDAMQQTIPGGTKLLLTDPPYGMNFQSNRRTVSEKAPKIANDDATAFDVLTEVLRNAFFQMAEDSTILIWSGWRYEPRFREIIENTGFEIRGSLIWSKPNHGTGDLSGTFAPKHERIIHATKGNPKLNFRPDDVLCGDKFLGTYHPTEKPVDLLQVLIEATTQPGDIVADPFAGTFSTIMAAHRCGRDYWGCELDDEWYNAGIEILYNEIQVSL